MKKVLYVLCLILLMLNPKNLMSQNVIYNFDNNSDLKNWVIVNDDVMGGFSSSNINIDDDGNGVFEGSISTANNGGFSSLRLNCNRTLIEEGANFQIKVKGDGKEYQFRLKANRDDYYSYILSFKTSSEWELITIPVNDMYASFRGRTLNMENFNQDYFEQITFLIGNQKNENFKLMIDEVTLLD